MSACLTTGRVMGMSSRVMRLGAKHNVARGFQSRSVFTLAARGPFRLSSALDTSRPHAPAAQQRALGVHTSSHRMSEGKEKAEVKEKASVGGKASAAPPAPTGLSAVVAKSQELAPGVVVAGAVMHGSFFIADHLGQMLMAAQGLEAAAKSPVSGVPVAILLGLLINIVVTLPAALKPGFAFCVTTALRAGIVCVGLKLSVFDVLELGAAGVPAVVDGLGVCHCLQPVHGPLS